MPRTTPILVPARVLLGEAKGVTKTSDGGAQAAAQQQAATVDLQGTTIGVRLLPG
jgi:hypothetical protein